MKEVTELVNHPIMNKTPFGITNFQLSVPIFELVSFGVTKAPYVGYNRTKSMN